MHRSTPFAGLWNRTWIRLWITSGARVLTALLVLAPASLAFSALGLPPVGSRETVLSGGQTTVFDAGHNAFGRALANLEPSHWPVMREGKRIFVRQWQPGTDAGGGLGPLYVADSCQSCHFKDGRGGIPREALGDPLGPQIPTPAPLVYRLSQPDPTLPGSWRGDPRYGIQLQTRATSSGDAPEGEVILTFEEKPGGLLDPLPKAYADGTPITLTSPRYRVMTAEDRPLDPTTSLSPRLPPSLVGIGLLEAADPAEILTWEDPGDADGDGISGRASWVATAEGLSLGRFGWKAGQAFLRDQAVAALAEDMGIVEPEISRDEVAQLTLYLQLLAPPARRRQQDPRVIQGEKIFAATGCDSCHRTTLTTQGPDSVPGPKELAGQVIHPYTDLLLHDLGSPLADDAGEGSLEGSATGAEWRTAPLWGLGLLEIVSGEIRLLHDGRARTFEEAILWHGGEARESRRRFLHLPATDRTALLEFLESL